VSRLKWVPEVVIIRVLATEHADELTGHDFGGGIHLKRDTS
jgi:hypothetical protein